ARAPSLRPRERNLPQKFGRGPPLLGVSPPPGGGRAAIRHFCGDRRSCRGRSLDRSGQRSGRRGADAGGGARGDRCLRRRASCRAAVPQARAQPRRSRGAGAARTNAERTRMSEPENFITRWSRRKREVAEGAEVTKSSIAPDAVAESAPSSEDPRQERDALP